MYVLQCGDYDDIIGWAPSGLAFVIMHPSAFEETVLPEIFKEAKFSSFQRKLKRWGFIKSKGNRGTISSCYFHPQFRRGDFLLCMNMSASNNSQEASYSASRLLSTIPTAPPPGSTAPPAPPAPLNNDTLLLTTNNRFDVKALLGSTNNDAQVTRMDDPIIVAQTMLAQSAAGDSSCQEAPRFRSRLQPPQFAAFNSRGLVGVPKLQNIMQDRAIISSFYTNEEPSLQRRLENEVRLRQVNNSMMQQQHLQEQQRLWKHQQEHQQEMILQQHHNISNANRTSGNHIFPLTKDTMFEQHQQLLLSQQQQQQQQHMYHFKKNERTICGGSNDNIRSKQRNKEF